MNDQFLRDANGQPIGRLSVDDSGEQRLSGQHGNYLGRYNPATNITSSATGQTVGFGNQLLALLSTPKPKSSR
jgi:hypothetical protein